MVDTRQPRRSFVNRYVVLYLSTLIVLIPIDGRQLDRTRELSQSFRGDANGAGPWPAR